MCFHISNLSDDEGGLSALRVAGDVGYSSQSWATWSKDTVALSGRLVFVCGGADFVEQVVFSRLGLR
jgi:hypothetical protein